MHPRWSSGLRYDHPEEAIITNHRDLIIGTQIPEQQHVGNRPRRWQDQRGHGLELSEIDTREESDLVRGSDDSQFDGSSDERSRDNFSVKFVSFHDLAGPCRIIS